MAKSKTVAMEFVAFDEAAQSAWDRHEDLRDRVSKLRKAETEQREIREKLLELFGDKACAKLPDGRVLLKQQKSRKLAAKPAHEQSWFEISEMP